MKNKQFVFNLKVKLSIYRIYWFYGPIEMIVTLFHPWSRLTAVYKWMRGGPNEGLGIIFWQ